MSRSTRGLLGTGRRVSICVVVGAVTAAMAACSGSPEVEVVAREAVPTSSSMPATTVPTEQTSTTSTVPTADPTATTSTSAPEVDIAQLGGLLTTDQSGQHLTVTIDGVRPVIDETAWDATWQTLGGRVLGDHIDQQPAGFPIGVVVAGAPTLRTEHRYLADSLLPPNGEAVEDHYEMLLEMPGVDDSVVAAQYIVDAVAGAVTDLEEYPNRREGVWEGDGGAYVSLDQPDASYRIGVVEASLPQPDFEERSVLRLTITRRIASSRLGSGAEPQGSLFDPLRDPVERLDIETPYEVTDLSRDVSTYPSAPVEPASAYVGATVVYSGIAAADMDPLLAEVAVAIGDDFERNDEYLSTGQVWFNPIDWSTDGSYVLEQVGSELVVTVVGQRLELPVVESAPPAQATIIGDDTEEEPADPVSNVIDFSFEGLTALDGDALGPAVETLAQGRTAAAVLAEDFDIEGMDPPILVSGAPIVRAEVELYGPEFDPDTGAVTSAEAYEVQYSQAVHVDGDVREVQLEIQAALADLLSEMYPGEALVEDSYEVIDGRFDDAVVVGDGFPQRLTVRVGPLDPVDETTSGDLYFAVRRYHERPDPASVGTGADWIDDDLAALIGVVEPAGPAVIESVAHSRYASGDGATLLAASGAQLEFAAPDGSDVAFATVSDLIESAGYEAEPFAEDSASFSRPEPDRLDYFFVLSEPDALIVFIDTDPVAV